MALPKALNEGREGTDDHVVSRGAKCGIAEKKKWTKMGKERGYILTKGDTIRGKNAGRRG